ncbi:MAG: HNH endonuclease, partial [Gemmatimonadota bacterium]|nr:HNH endonuclease [Gemmatimonadota bacterium]
MFDRSADERIRAATFEWLAGRIAEHGDILPRTVLAQGFRLDGTRIPLLGPQGIFKPRVLDLPLSITTSPNSPYDDTFGADGLLEYRYRGTDPNHRDNVGLRAMMERELPLVYFHGVVPGRYVAAWPVFIVGDRPDLLTFSVAVDDPEHLGLGGEAHLSLHEPESEGRRRYVTSLVRRRLHQKTFRERVLAAYRSECSFCRFRHEELLDAAHILPDSELG